MRNIFFDWPSASITTAATRGSPASTRPSLPVKQTFCELVSDGFGQTLAQGENVICGCWGWDGCCPAADEAPFCCPAGGAAEPFCGALGGALGTAGAFGAGCGGGGCCASACESAPTTTSIIVDFARRGRPITIASIPFRSRRVAN